MFKNPIIRFFFRTAFMLLVTLLLTLILLVQPVFKAKNTMPSLARVKSLKSSVYQLSETLLKSTSIANLLDVKADYIFQQMKKYQTDVNYQEFDVMGLPHRNIVVTIRGKNPRCGLFVIGAHYDSYDNLAGADDNSSGVAGLIELGSLYSTNPPICDLQLVAYTLEEPPYFRSEFMGSYIHAKELKDKQVDVKLMLSLEMIGYFNDNKDSQDYPINGLEHLYSDRGNFISIVGNLSQISVTRFFKASMRGVSDLPVYSINAPSLLAGIDFSDHLNYWRFGFPALMISDTAFNRNKNYHTAFDTADRLNYRRMAQVVDAVYYALQQYMLEEVVTQ